MAYQVVKGWPANGAIDEVIAPAADENLQPGFMAAIDEDGKGIVANYAVDGTDAGKLVVFLIDKDAIKEQYTGLMGSQYLIEVDADHYEPGTYAANTPVTANGGKFDLIADTGDDRPAIGKVRSFDPTTGKMRVLFNGNL